MSTKFVQSRDENLAIESTLSEPRLSEVLRGWSPSSSCYARKPGSDVGVGVGVGDPSAVARQAGSLAQLSNTVKTFSKDLMKPNND